MDSSIDVYNAIRKIIPVGDVYLVGGCVRDSLMGFEPKDYDCCSSFTPDEIENFCKQAGRHVYAIGKKYGTIGFKVNVNDKWVYVEHTTYRGEKYTPGNRKPEVTYVDSLEEDLSRRDFTINSMAFGGSIENPELVDLFGGRMGILNKQIKPVGQAKDRFREDPLRILRAVRFANRFDFEIEKNMFGEMRKARNRLFDVSIERWVIELDKMLESQNPIKAIKILEELDILEMILPEVAKRQIYNEKNLIFVGDIDKRWKLFLSGIGDDFVVNKKHPFGAYVQNSKRTKYLQRSICLRLKFSNQRMKTILA